MLVTHAGVIGNQTWAVQVITHHLDHGASTTPFDTFPTTSTTHTHLFPLEEWMIQSISCRETLCRIHHKQLRDLLAHITGD